MGVAFGAAVAALVKDLITLQANLISVILNTHAHGTGFHLRAFHVARVK
jgi:hypothetical protein